MKKCFSWKYLKVPVKPVVRKNKTAKKFKDTAIIEEKSSCKRGPFFKGMEGGYFLPLGPF